MGIGVATSLLVLVVVLVLDCEDEEEDEDEDDFEPASRIALYNPDTAAKIKVQRPLRQETKTGVSDGPNTFWRAGVARGKSTTTANSSETPRASRTFSYPPVVAGECFIP